MGTPPPRIGLGVTLSGVVVGIAVAIIVFQGLAFAGWLPLPGGNLASPDLRGVTGELRNATAELQAAAGSVRDLGRDLQASTLRLDNASVALSLSLGQVSAAADRLNTSSNRLADVAASLAERTLLLDELARNLTREIAALKDIQGGNTTSNQTENFTAQVRDLENQVQDLHGRLANQSLVVADLSVDLNATVAENTQLRAQVEVLGEQVVNLTARNEVLRQELAARPLTPRAESPGFEVLAAAAAAVLGVALARRRRAKP